MFPVMYNQSHKNPSKKFKDFMMRDFMKIHSVEHNIHTIHEAEQ